MLPVLARRFLPLASAESVRFSAVLGLLAVAARAQTPAVGLVVPDPPPSPVYMFAAMPSEARGTWRAVQIAPPLKLSTNAKGEIVLGVADWSTTGNCVLDSVGNLFCSSLGAGYTQVPRTVRGETPAADPVTPGTWHLAHAPAAITCWRNGLRQAPGVDFVFNGDTLTSALWMPGELLACDYEWLPPSAPVTLRVQNQRDVTWTLKSAAELPVP